MATYYISTSGSDGASGAILSPWRTVAKAANTMVAGDTTYVRGGTYTEGAIQFDASGTLAAPITLQNYPSESPIITSTDQLNSSNQLLVSGLPTSGPTTPISDIVLRGLEITNRYTGVKLQGSLRFLLEQCYIHDNGSHALQGTQTGGNKDATVNRNRLVRNGSSNQPDCFGNPLCNQYHGMYIMGTNWTITNNVIQDNLGFGLQADSGLPSVSPNNGTYGGFTGIVTNNTFIYGRNRAGMVAWANGVQMANCTIQNNIFYENSQNYVSSCQGIELEGGGGYSNVVIKDNIWYGTGNSSTIFYRNNPDGGTQVVPAGVTFTNNTHSQPVFVNAGASTVSSPNVRLSAGSQPALTLGTNLYTVHSILRTDLDGNPRPSTGSWALGAYTPVGTVDTTPPATPTGLAVI